MAHGTTALGYKRDSDQFPIFYEGRGVRIYKNPCDEVFIENIESGVIIRLNAIGDGLVFTTDGRVEPTYDLRTGWCVSPR